MTKGLDWRRAKLAGKRSLSELDDRERRKGDAAARWLKRVESWKKPRHGKQPRAGRSA